MKRIFFVLLVAGLLLPLSLFAQSNPTPIGDVLSDSSDEDIVTIQGRVTRFEDEDDRDEMSVVDPTGKIWVELEERHEALGIKKGNEVEITGELDQNFFTKSMKMKAIDIDIKN